MRVSVYLAVPLMLLLAVLETAVLSHLPLFNQTPQLPFLVALSWGLLRDLEEGVIWAFIGGILLDLFSVTPLGLTPLAWMVAIAMAILIIRPLTRSRVILPTLVAALATILYLGLGMLLLRLFGYQVTSLVTAVLLPMAMLHALLILPIYWLMYLADKRLSPRRVQV